MRYGASLLKAAVLHTGAETLHQVDVADQVGHHRDHHAGVEQVLVDVAAAMQAGRQAAKLLKIRIK